MLTLTFKPWHWAIDYADEAGMVSFQVGPLVVEFSYS